jgi:hypothetical protein
MSDNITWDSVSIEFLQKTTRDLKFDWNAISKALLEYFQSNGQSMIITPQVCRQQYATMQSFAPLKAEKSSGNLFSKVHLLSFFTPTFVIITYRHTNQRY